MMIMIVVNDYGDDCDGARILGQLQSRTPQEAEQEVFGAGGA